MRRSLMTILAFFALGYLGFCLFVYLNQDRMLFFPSRATADELARIARLEGCEPWLDAEGRQIGWQSTRDTDAPTALLVLNGNGGYALHRNYAAFRATPVPMRLYLLEYPGYGARPGPVSTDAMVSAAIEAIDAVPENVRLLVLGQSLGSGVACAAAAQRPGRIAGLALLTPFESLQSGARYHYPWLPASLLLRHRLDSDRNLERYHGKVAFIVAGADETTPAKLGERLSESYAGPKQLWLVPEAGHNSFDTLLADWPGVVEWLLK